MELFISKIPAIECSETFVQIFVSLYQTPSLYVHYVYLLL